VKGASKKRKPYIFERAREAREIITFLKTFESGFQLHEWAFIISLADKLDKFDAPYISGKQIAWLRHLNERMFH
jgi:hypothetical protein